MLSLDDRTVLGFDDPTLASVYLEENSLEWNLIKGPATEDGDTFLAKFQVALARHPVTRHPFLNHLQEMPVTREQLALYAAQHYMYSQHFQQNLAALVSNVPDEDARAVLIANLFEESGEPGYEGNKHDTHPALFRRYLKALGLDAEDVRKMSAAPETALFITKYQYLCRHGPWLEAVAGMGLGTESMVPKLYAPVLAAIQREGSISKDDSAFWRVHIEGDSIHGARMIDALRRYAYSPTYRSMMARGALRVLDARRVWFDGLDRLIFTAKPTPAGYTEAFREETGTSG